MSFPLDKLKLTEHAAEVMVYFERHKIMEIVARLVAEINMVRPPDAQLWIAKNIRRIANNIYAKSLESNCFNHKKERFYTLPGRFLYRVVIFGRVGSGRKTQAVALAKRFRVVYVDAEQLIYANLYEKDDLAKELQYALSSKVAHDVSMAIGKIITRRLLQPDALQNGWVLVNYPNNLFELKELFENFKIPPNKLIYLICPKIIALRRLIEKPNFERPRAHNCNYIEKQMLHFKINEPVVNEYLERRHETIYIDAAPCCEAVRTSILAALMNKFYVMGFKN